MDARARLAGLVHALKSELPGDQIANMVMDAEVLDRVERWFTQQMDRTTGTYKRWTQVWTLAVALALTLAFDLDAGRIAAELQRNAAVRSALAGRVTGEIAGRTLASRPVDQQAGGAARRLDVYAPRCGAWRRVGGWTALAGWLIPVIALGLGAPFWFDTLNRVVNLRQTGPRPDAGRAAP